MTFRESGRGMPQTGGGRTQWNEGQGRGQFGASPEAGLHRGEWQWRGHAPGAAANYGWEYQGGVARDTPTMRTEAGMGPRGYYEHRLAEERSGGLPRGRERFDADRWRDQMAGDPSRGSGMRGGGGYDRPYNQSGSAYAGGYGRDRGLENDPRWRGNADRIRAELNRGVGVGNTARGVYRYDSEITRDRGILRGYDGGFGYRRDYRW